MNKKGTNRNGVWILIAVVALILVGMFVQSKYELFVISGNTDIYKSCAEYIPEATYGAIAGQCYLSGGLDALGIGNGRVYYVINVTEKTNSNNVPPTTLCHVEVTSSLSSRYACAEGVVKASLDTNTKYCNSDTDCSGTVCTNHYCSTKTVGSCSYPQSNKCTSTNQYQQCLSNGLWSGTLTCDSGLICSNGNCITPPTTCTSFTYSDFSDCQSNNKKYRTILTSSPANCINGNPILSQDCVFVPACTEDNWQFSLTSCLPSNTQTKTWTKIGNCVNGVSHSTETLTCNYQAPACQYTYGAWGACQSSGVQARTFAASPANCQGTPVTSQACNYVISPSPSTTFDISEFLTKYWMAILAIVVVIIVIAFARK